MFCDQLQVVLINERRACGTEQDSYYEWNKHESSGTRRVALPGMSAYYITDADIVVRTFPFW